MILPLLAVSVSLAQTTMTAPPVPATARQLRDEFVECVDVSCKQRALDRLARTPPTGLNDVLALYDLFMRFPEDPARQAALDSLQLMSPTLQEAEPLLLRFLQEEEPASVLFGIKGALRLRSAQALPLLNALAKAKFKHASAGDASTITERNRWWVQYEALSALAQWQRKDALPLLIKKSKEAPAVARLIGLYLWPDALPLAVEWSKGSESDKARASAALEAPTPLGVLRGTREALEKLVLDPKADAELRHSLAIKLGLSSTPEEIGALLKKYDETKDAQTQRLIAAALFASRDPQIVPLLVRFSKEDPQPGVRAGARVQLKDMMPPAEYKAVLEWAAKSDPDPENRAAAERELKQP